MEKLVITGGHPLAGRVRVAGAKNAVLPLMAAALMVEGETVLEDVPALEDVSTMLQVLAHLGTETHYGAPGRLHLTSPAKGEGEVAAPYDVVRRMRASFLVLGPLLACRGRAEVPLPGGCAIGGRPVDLHLKGLAALGAEVSLTQGMIRARARRLTGAHIYLDFPSVGATENILMAASLAHGETVIENAASEPEVVDLANFLCAAGARIRGAGTGVIRVNGVSGLRGLRHTVIPDRIEAGTFMVAAAITGGSVTVENIVYEHLKPVAAKLTEMGCAVELSDAGDAIRVTATGTLKATDVKTLPYPGFPTDMQSPFLALLTQARGTGVVTETVFENRFLAVPELKRLGANIRAEGRTAVVEGRTPLAGAEVTAPDLRGGAALVLAGLAAEGETSVTRLEHLARGYERLAEKLVGLGAQVKRVNVTNV
ncbi:MAG TPA: UDP-N-acetylglucosamine 1-carboxyvinyltransferase [Firmicutes bacterium]|nr:UDP-N-acetylglucosamine 1-carboxyvinyltransferase [Bacillota bacterium]